MKVPNLRPLALSICAMVLLTAWAAVIWIALTVSEIVLNSLDMIIKLAGM